MRLTLTTIAISLALGGAAFAGALPDSAKKLTKQEVQKLYSGKSASWKKSTAYFAPDGSFYLVNKANTVISKGSWSASGNKVCNKHKWTEISTGKKGSIRDCWSWFKDGKTYYILWSGNPGKKNYYTNEIQKLKSGDRVTAKYKKLAAKLN